MADFARSHRLLLEGIKNFSIIFKILWHWKVWSCIFWKYVTVKNRGLSFQRFCRLLLGGTFNFLRKISPKSQQRIVVGWKQFMNFCKMWWILAILTAYLLRGYFYRRTNLAISIRYISEKNSQEGKNTASCQDGTKRNREWYGSNWPIPKRKSSIHSAYAHRLRPRRKSSRKEAQHSLRNGQGQERGDKWIRHLTV